MYGLPSLFPSYKVSIKPVITPTLLPLTQVCLTGSVYTVLMVSIERYLSICKPFNPSRHRVSSFPGLGYIAFTLIFWFAYNINKFLELETVYQTKTIGNKRFVYVWIFFDMIPCLSEVGKQLVDRNLSMYEETCQFSFSHSFPIVNPAD